MDVRRVALDQFGEAAIKRGEPLATMEEALVPLFLYHRYQTQAASKIVAGQYYTYALRGDGQEPLRPVSAREQQRALDALLRTLRPAELTIPRTVLATLPPRPLTYGPHQELFRRQTGLVFDAVAPASTAAGFTLEYLFDPERAARMVQQKALDPSLPGLSDVIDQVRGALFDDEPADAYQAEVGRAVQQVVVDQLMTLAAQAPMPQVRAEAEWALLQLAEEVEPDTGSMDPAYLAHYWALASRIGRFLDRPHVPVQPPAQPSMPPGDPIGDPGMDWLSGIGSSGPLTAGTPRMDLSGSWDAWWRR